MWLSCPFKGVWDSKLVGKKNWSAKYIFGIDPSQGNVVNQDRGLAYSKLVAADEEIEFSKKAPVHDVISGTFSIKINRFNGEGSYMVLLEENGKIVVTPTASGTCTKTDVDKKLF